LMLRHVFECWKLNRIEIISDMPNAQPIKAIARLGAT
jgi:hypothetical protein